MFAQRVNDGMRNMVQRQYAIHHAQFYGGARHAIHHAGGFILRQIDGPGSFQLLHALRAVTAHAGEQHAHGVAPGALGGGVK